MKSKILAFVLCVILSLNIIASPIYAYADTEGDTATGEVDLESKDEIKSIKKDMFMPVLHKKVSDGTTLLDILSRDADDEEDPDKKSITRKELNFEIAKGSATKSYSLFDRFGGTLSYPLYLGEELITTNAADKIYTFIDRGDEIGLNFETIDELFFRENITYENEFYSSRPPLKNSTTDPRVSRYGNGAGDDQLLGVANYFLGTTELVTQITAFLIGDKFVDFTADIIKGVFESEVYEALKNLILAFSAIFGIFLIIYIVRVMIKFSVAKISFRESIVNITGSILTMVFVIALVSNPLTVVNVSESILKFADNLVAEAFNATAKNEVVKSDINDNVMEATLFSVAVLDPWCEGVFGKKYDELYTQYDESGGTKLEQSDKSKLATGDIFVPLGNDKQVRNWGALAYSCTSIYHLDALGEMEEIGSDREIDNWPKAYTTKNRAIYNDDFRWVDAMLNVGETSGSSVTSTYENYNNFEFHGLTSSLYSLWLAVLMLPITYLGARKVVCMVQVLGNVMILLYRCCLNVIMPDNAEYKILQNLKAMFMPLRDYFWFTIIVMVVVYLYTTLVSSGEIVSQGMYIALAIYLCMTMPENIKSQGKAVRRVATDAALHTKSSIENFNQNRKNMKREEFEYKNIGTVKGNAIRNDPKLKDKEAEEVKDKREQLKEESEENDQVKTYSARQLTPEDYRNAESTARNSKTNTGQYAGAAEGYRELWRNICSYTKNEDVYNVINKWRADKLHREWDRELLGIDLDAIASKDLHGKVRSDYYDVHAKNSVELDKHRRKVGNNARGYDEIKAEYEAQFNNAKDERERQKTLKKQLKAMKKDDRKAHFDTAEAMIANITGNARINSIVGLEAKLYIALGLVGAYLGGALLCLIFGS